MTQRKTMDNLHLTHIQETKAKMYTKPVRHKSHEDMFKQQDSYEVTKQYESKQIMHCSQDNFDMNKTLKNCRS